MPAPAYLTDLHETARRAVLGAQDASDPNTETLKLIASLLGRLVEAAEQPAGGAQ